ncbi:bifunctional DNA-formamidopyrimidine glycosylase/DNA-(apurinic or apyrimidinic site) lyase [Nitratidesulfovibrio termitidis]|uniref:bifunctional DNA-formamidopyrimidine glycosylase/DNA-(apurinic or apyrimidinic site) lyase n=1 Tax=Nitratidesulfovibrio termitidis TaxID=42252 RepID=UPI0003F56085|nr:bifunctional DNA-formamidopyrimidine glycosylase/DNA-(apurinic or apyrimidinic site) lyase [Nitratidesulfovibrio termitidis]
MPELPEVETIACGLRPQLTGRRIVSVSVRNEGTVQGDAAAFARCVPGRVISGVGRRGKLLLMELAPPDGGASGAVGAGAAASSEVPSGARPDAADLMACGDAAGKVAGSCEVGTSGGTGGLGGNRVPHLLGVHLKMTGRLFVYGPEVAPNAHTRVVFGLDDGNRLFFDDARKFGYVRALSDADMTTWDFWRSLGPEPLEIAGPDFVALFRGRRGRIKALLLDQTVIAGIGNIYADESLFRASIRPDAQAGELSPDRLRVLHGHLVDVLRESIAECGSSIRDYRDAHGDAGAFQNRFRVYGRTGQPCVACGRTLTTAKVAGRTTVFCERCQKLK